MNAIGEYVIGICAAAVICAITLCFAEKGPMQPLLKLICGLILTFSLVDPILNLQSGDFSDLGIDFRSDAQEAADYGKQQAEKGVRQIIKEETEAYILDKASELNLEISVSVSLSDQALPVPESVVISGTVPPYGKSRLSRILTRELGIAKENQQWIS